MTEHTETFSFFPFSFLSFSLELSLFLLLAYLPPLTSENLPVRLPSPVAVAIQYSLIRSVP